jgi:hypothetical protein
VLLASGHSPFLAARTAQCQSDLAILSCSWHQHLAPERMQHACTAVLILHVTPALSLLGAWLCANSLPLVMVFLVLIVRSRQTRVLSFAPDICTLLQMEDGVASRTVHTMY